jgi:hypothetical protein
MSPVVEQTAHQRRRERRCVTRLACFPAKTVCPPNGTRRGGTQAPAKRGAAPNAEYAMTKS